MRCVSDPVINLDVSIFFHTMPVITDLNCLRSEEISYEILIRGVKPPATLEEKRKVLRGLLAQEDANRSFSSLTPQESFTDTVKAVTDSLKSVTEALRKPPSEFTTSDNRKCVAKLTHVTGRLRRAKPSDEAETTEQQALLTQILCLESDLADKLSPAPADFHSTPVSQQSFTYSKKIPVHKWGIRKFGGREPLMPFLELVESLKDSRGCSDRDVFESAGDLFESEAWTWWYSNHSRGRFSDWKDLVTKLRDTFLNSDYDQIVLDEIRARKQKPSEPVSIFISVMESKFHRLTQLSSEEEMVVAIRRNLLPDYVRSLILQDIKTVPDLVSLCKKVEDTLSLSSPTPPVHNHRKTTDKVCSIAVGRGPVCWNCGNPNHTYSNCHKPRGFFCYGCGRRGVSKASCRSCSKNGHSGHSRTDVVGPSVPIKKSVVKTFEKNVPKRK